MFEVAYCVSGASSHEIDFNQDHLARIYDRTISSNILKRFKSLLEMKDDVQVYSIKLVILKCLCLLSIGNSLLAFAPEIKQRLEY
jgi:hypothetical protein